jgi:hypothetical protein
MMFADPTRTALTSPTPLTVATELALVLQVTVRPVKTFPDESLNTTEA